LGYHEYSKPDMVDLFRNDGCKMLEVCQSIVLASKTFLKMTTEKIEGRKCISALHNHRRKVGFTENILHS
jgi:hypothetical protein